MVFIGFAVITLGESLKWNYLVAFIFMFIAVYFAVAIK
jgi:uncharacterized protein (DUF486 family)